MAVICIHWFIDKSVSQIRTLCVYSGVFILTFIAASQGCQCYIFATKLWPSYNAVQTFYEANSLNHKGKCQMITFGNWFFAQLISIHVLYMHVTGLSTQLGPWVNQQERRGAMLKIHATAIFFGRALAAVLIGLSTGWHMARTVKS